MARVTTRLESSTAFTAYFVTYACGFAGLMYLTRALPLDGVVRWLPFGLPVALLAILAVGARAEEQEPERVLEHRSLLGRTFARVGPPLRTYPLVGMTAPSRETTSRLRSRSGSATGRRCSSAESSRLKIAVLAPTPRASVIAETRANPGASLRPRTA